MSSRSSKMDHIFNVIPDLMDNTIKSILEDAGWYSGRAIEIDYMLNDLKLSGITAPNTYLENLLKEYSNLGLEFQRNDGRYGSIRLNTEVARDIGLDILIRYETALGERLLPLGSIDWDSALLIASHSGKFYMAAEGKFYKIGDSFTRC